MLAILTPSFYVSENCLNEIAAARDHGLTIIPLLFELAEDGQPPWSTEPWSGRLEKLESSGEHDEVERLKTAKRELGRLNSEPSPPGTMLEQSGLLEKLVETVRGAIRPSGP